MGIDPETDDVMARPPRKANERAIDARMWRGVIEIGLVVALATLLTLDFYLPGGLIEGSQMPSCSIASTRAPKPPAHSPICL